MSFGLLLLSIYFIFMNLLPSLICQYIIVLLHLLICICFNGINPVVLWHSLFIAVKLNSFIY